ncbi:MAG: hypothetical protein WCP28_02730 [Actinomycetes bacterium]
MQLLQIYPVEQAGEAVLPVLQPLCGGSLTLDLVEDLLEPDAAPDLDVSNPQVRRLSTIAAHAFDDADHDTTSLVGTLELAPIEFLIGPTFVVVCWHSYSRVGSAGEVTGVGVLREKAIDNVERWWVAKDGHTAGDLAAVYGANTEPPGLNSWEGFVTMLVLMVLAAAVSATIIWVLRRPTSPRVLAGRQSAEVEQPRPATTTAPASD